MTSSSSGSGPSSTRARYVWITHPDPAHTGGLMQVLDAAPQAKLVTTFGGYSILSLQHDIPVQRLHLVNPGGALDVGDRLLHGCGLRCSTAR